MLPEVVYQQEDSEDNILVELGYDAGGGVRYNVPSRRRRIAEEMVICVRVPA
jgi:hypothetical protein